MAVTVLALAAAPAASADPGPALSVNVDSGRHAISPYIYGWNFAPAAFAKEIDLPVDRRGGNSADTLNWQTGVENHSNDYFFENLPTCWSNCPAGWDPARSYTDQIGADRDAHAQTLLDLPMLGILPKDFGDNNQVFCSFSVAKYGAQTEVDPYDNDCGNGVKSSNGHPVVNDPGDSGTPHGPEFQGAWIDDLKQRYGDAAS